MRKELRLIAPLAIVTMISSSLVFMADAPLGLSVRRAVLLSSMAALMAVGALVIFAWREEERLGTLLPLIASPLNRVFAVEKAALSAFFVALTVFTLQAVSFADLPGLARSLPTVAMVIVTLGPLQLFKLRSEWVAYGLLVFLYVMIAVSFYIELEWPPFVPETLTVGAALVTLAFAYRDVRRHGLVGPVINRGLLDRPLSWFPKQARDQRLALMMLFLMLAMPAATLPAFALVGESFREGLFVLPGMIGLFTWLAPTMVFAEHRQALDVELSMLPRAQVFRAKALSTLLMGILPGMIVPLVMAAVIDTVSVAGAIAWVLTCLLVWSMAMASATILKSSMTASAATVLGAGALVGLQLFALELGGCAVTGQMGSVLEASVLASAMVVLVPATLVFAWRRFVGLRPRPARDAVLLICACVAHAMILGVGATLLGLNWVGR